MTFMPPANSLILYRVLSEEDARKFAVPLGQTMWFINDNAPFIYCKTMGNTFFEGFSFRIFRTEEVTPPPQELPNQKNYMTTEQFDQKMTEFMAQLRAELAPQGGVTHESNDQ